MAARDFVVKWLGEGVARKIEQFVNGVIFEEQSVTCPRCGRLVPAALVVEREVCPVCQEKATNRTMIDALEAQKTAAQAAGTAAINDAQELERRLSTVRKRD
jgi:hypothetical protein